MSNVACTPSLERAREREKEKERENKDNFHESRAPTHPHILLYHPHRRIVIFPLTQQQQQVYSPNSPAISTP